MPLYAFKCSHCDASFETLVRDGDSVSCAACGGAQVERQLSLIARPAPGGESGSSPDCAAMSGGSPCGACPALSDA